MLLNQGAPRIKKTPVAHGLADRRAFKQKSAPPCYRRSAISRVFAKSAIKQPSRLRRPWRMLPDRRRRGRDRSALYWARHLRHRLTLASAACQYKPFRLTDTTVRLHIGQGISGIASLSPTSPAYAWRFRLTHGLADRRAFNQKAPRPVTGGAQFLALC